jgi:hypothetical protein
MGSRRLVILAAGTAATTLALGAAGCGITNPYTNITANTRTATSTTTPRPAVSGTDADPVPERGGTMPPAASRRQSRLASGAGAPTPQAALERYAQLYINWTATDLPAEQRRLASISLGSARAQALQAAASYRHDATLIASHVANAGTVVAIVAGQSAAAGQWVVVTSETTSGHGDYQGLPTQVHVTYAQLKQTPKGWLVTAWEPRA